MSSRLEIAMLVPGMPCGADSMAKHSLGGSETAGLSLAKEMAVLGHSVKVFCNTPKPHNDDKGVSYFPIDYYKMFAPTTPHDVFIAQRAPEVFGVPLASKLNVLWVHDLPLLRQAQAIRSSMWNIDTIYTVSQYHADKYMKVFDLPESVFHPTRNGIHLSMTPKAQKRDMKQVVYTARPERGLDVLLKGIMPKIWKMDPEIKLVISAYDNTVAQMRDFYAHLNDVIRGYGDRVVMAGALKKEDLYKLYATSGAYLYPTPSPTSPLFREVSCITAMECMMCGLPFISSDKGALSETLHPDAGMLLDGDPTDEDYQHKFAARTISVLGDPIKHAKMSTAGRKHATNLDWSGVAKEWIDHFTEMINERSSNKKTVARHLIRQSDIMAASKVADDINDELLQGVIDTHWGFRKGDISKHYEKIGQTHTDVFEATLTDPRWEAVKRAIERLGITSGKMLDYGCSHGSYALHLSNTFPDLKIDGVDFDKFGIEWAEKHKKNHAKHPENLNFRTVTGPDDVEGEYDFIFLGEIIEHTLKPWEVIDSIEKVAKPGARMLITTPYGPWEEDSYSYYPHRGHLWELSLPELREMLEGKDSVTVDMTYLAKSSVRDEPLGFCITSYKVNPEKGTKPVNIDRKIAETVPRQTVSISMICGPGVEKTLEWCLDSVIGVADEIIIGNAGMSQAALDIAGKYGATIIPAPNPLEVGFDESRNATLPHCTMDWILWIDDDEKLINPNKLHKYLRNNIFVGYGIKQHHFSIDAQFDPDMPVRLFRNGKGLKWFGSCHEHPETALNEGPGTSIVISDVHIAHVGYLNEPTRRKRFSRNSPLMEMSRKRYPERLLNKFFTMRDKMLVVHYALQQGQSISQGIESECQDVIDLYREFFCGKSIYMVDEARKYYSDACRVLGIGAEVAIAVNSAKQDKPSTLVQTHHYANVEDLQADLAAKAKQSMEQFCDPNW
jgi:glycosyltransferase involved in cell wall biosynthesis